MGKRKAKLNQILAIEKGVKTKFGKEITALHHAATKSDLYSGHHRKYEALQEEGITYPDEQKHVQLRYPEVLERLEKALSEIFDVVAAKDLANTKTSASVYVGENLIFKDMPVSFLLYVEKQLDDVFTFVEKLPVLDPGEKWTWDDGQNLYVSEEIKTFKTEKTPTVFVKYAATEKHPAQTELLHIDKNVGTWHKRIYSGAIPAERKQIVLDRIHALRDAVKFAREDANQIEAEIEEVGRKMFSYIFAP